ncbi:MAG: hypothetical protein KA791_01820 [Flavobacteriales bacterium]|nr:hypothetical protein [Flavobacteriales bacterium]
MRPHFRAALLGVFLLPLRVGAQQYDIRVFGVEDGLPGSTVTAIAQDSAGFLWVETDGGVCRYNGTTFQRMADQVWPLTSGSSRSGPSYAGGQDDEDGTTCVLTSRTTGYAWQGHTTGVRVFTRADPITPLFTLSWENGLTNNGVTTLFEDASGIMWIGTKDWGLCRYNSDAVVIHGKEKAGAFTKALAFHRSPEGTAFLVGGEYGFQYQWSTGASRTGTGEHPGGAWRTFSSIDANRLFAANDSGLAMIVPPSHSKGHGSPFGRYLFTAAPVWDLATGPGDHLFAGTSKGVIDLSPELSWIRVGRDSASATRVAVHGDSLLIGTHHGLFSAPLDNSAANWTPMIRAGQEDITCLTVDRAGNIWIGTANDGVVRYRHGTAQRWTTREGLVSDRILQLLLDAYQNLWVGTDRGFHLMELDELQEEVIDISYYGIEEGFPGIEAMPNACMLDTDSSLWFGTTRGTIHYDPRKVLQDPVPPHTRITELTLFFEHPDWRPWSDTLNADGLPLGLRLPYDRNHLTFTFTGLSLAYPEKVRFQYMLEGHDADWSPITKEDHVTFSGLEPGKYAFLVKARNGSGVWNDEPARFTFIITPPFWETLPFRLAGGGALLLGLFGAQRLRDRRSRKARERLERIVATRTQELTDEKHRSDTLLLNILPETTAAELKEFGSAQARSYANCTVLFSDFQGFTVLSEQFEATGIVTELDRFFRAFDRITDKFGTEKIKTIGDAYMCASGVPEPSPTHALDAVLMALEMLSVVDNINALRESEGHPAWPIRIGLNSGPLIAGVVGEKKFAYDVWGDTVNLASRMESSGAPGRVNVTGSVMAHVEAYVVCEPRGRVTVKGKGEVESWFIDRLRPEYSADELGRSANEHLMALRNTLRTA